MNNLFQGTNAVRAAVPTFGFTEGRLLTLLLVVFVIVVVYLVIGKALPSFIPNLIPMSTSVYWKAKRVWAPSGVTTNLTAYPSQFGTPHDVAYSFNMDLVLKETRTNDTAGLHRHIFHRGSEEYASATPPAALPRRMNPGVFLDPLTNDLLLFVDTLGGTTGYRESLRIADLPLGTPFRLGIVMNHRTLDIYINCMLEETKLLQGTPRTVENRLYGVAGPSPAPAQVQNVYCWDYALSANEITSLCGSVPSVTLTPTCAVAPPSSGATNTGVTEAATSNASLGSLRTAFTEDATRLVTSIFGVTRNIT